MAALLSAGVGLDFPDEGVDGVLPFVDVAGFSVFSIAFAAVILAPSSGGGVSFGADVAPGTLPPIDRTFGLGATASAPIDKVFTGAAGVEDGSFVFDEGVVLEGLFASTPVGRFAIIGTRCGCWLWGC